MWQPDVRVLLVVHGNRVVRGGVGHATHPVHRFDGVEPTLPAPASQVLPDPGCFQILEGVEVGGGQPRVLQALRGGDAMFRVYHQELLDEVDGFLGHGAKRFLVEIAVDQLAS